MGERDFQAALLHLYRAAADNTEPPACPNLSARERLWLNELIASQRKQLHFVGARLRAKRRRFAWHALQSANRAFPELLNALLEDWSQASPLEASVYGPDTLRSFAAYLAAQRRPGTEKALAFLRFDALCAAVSLSGRNRDTPDALLPTLRLGLGDDVELTQCEFDLSALQDATLLDEAEPLPSPQHALLFRNQDCVQSLALSPGLAGALASFDNFSCLRQVVEVVQPAAAQGALLHSLGQLLLLGVPFFDAGRTIRS